MIIEAKGSKNEETQSRSAARFETGPERLTRLPMYFAMAIIGLAAYLKSSMAGHAAAPPSSPGPASPDAKLDQPTNWCLPNDELLSASLLGEKGVDETVTGSVGGGSGPRNQIGTGLPWPDPFVVPDFPSISFAVPPKFVLPSIAGYFPGAFNYVQGNDNDPHSGGGSNPEDGEDLPDRGDDDNEDDDEETNPPNRAPIVAGPVRLNDVFAGQVVLIALSQFLFGASDPDGDNLTVLSMSVTGTTLVRVQGGWRLETEPGMLGPVTFQYKISDGERWVPQTAYLEIVRKQHLLTPCDDVYVASPYDDDIDGLSGDDIIDGLAGNDMVRGGAGDDHIYGGDGADHLFGGAGNDVLLGGAGNDLLFGEEGDDRLFGDEGDDTLDGGSGNDWLYGGAGNDTGLGGSGNDTIAGDAGNDVLEGGEGCDVIDGGAGADVLLGQADDDRLYGGADADFLDGGTGDDRLYGGAGNDTLTGGAGCDVIDGGSGDDRVLGDANDDEIDGGEGIDRLDYSAATGSMIIDAATGTAYGAGFGEDSFSGIERIDTGDGDDMFVIGATATIVSGGRGKDTFVFEVCDDDPEISEDIFHDILDFVVGDRIRVREYDIDREAQALEADAFRRIYDDEDEDWLKSDFPIVVQHVRYDDVDNTIIKADIDHDNYFDITITIHGIHLPFDSNTSVA